MGTALSIALSVPLSLMVKQMIEFAGAAEDSEAKFAQVMGSMSDSVRAWSVQMTNAIGVSSITARDVAADFASILKGSELNTEAAANFSTKLVELAADMRAFKGGSLEEALTAIRSGLSGIAIPLKKFSIDITGLKTSGDKAADSITRLEEIFKRADLAGIMGQAAREADTFSGAMLRLHGNIKDISTIFGQSFLPVAKAALKFFNSVVAPVLKFVGSILKATTVLKFLVIGTTGLLIVLGPLLIVFAQIILTALTFKTALAQLKVTTDLYTLALGRNSAAANTNAVALTRLGAVSTVTTVAVGAAAAKTGLFSKILAGLGLAAVFKYIGSIAWLGTAARVTFGVFRTFGKFMFGPWGIAIGFAIEGIILLVRWLSNTEKAAKATGAALAGAASAAAANFGGAISQSGLAAIGGGGFAAAFSSTVPTSSTASTGGKDITRKTLGEKLDRIDRSVQEMSMKFVMM